MAKKFNQHASYRLKVSGQKVVIHSLKEKNGNITMEVDIFTSHGPKTQHDVRLTGITPDDLEECKKSKPLKKMSLCEFARPYVQSQIDKDRCTINPSNGFITYSNIDGVGHRTDGPAIIMMFGHAWVVNGKVIREDLIDDIIRRHELPPDWNTWTDADKMMMTLALS